MGGGKKKVDPMAACHLALRKGVGVFIVREERRVGSGGIFQCGCQGLVSEHMDMLLLDFNLEESSVHR
jgi:hypothetical protein